ncbi:hypothetical protein [Thiolapillus sp.]
MHIEAPFHKPAGKQGEQEQQAGTKPTQKRFMCLLLTCSYINFEGAILTKNIYSNGISFNLFQLIMGMGSLVLGLMIYIIDRNPDSVYFISALNIKSLYYSNIVPVFGKVGLWIPSFLHVTSFSLMISSLLVHPSRKNYILVIGLVVLVNIVFELGQISSGATTVDHYLLNYFSNGTFDQLDIVFILLGGGFSYFYSVITMCRS